MEGTVLSSVNEAKKLLSALSLECPRAMLSAFRDGRQIFLIYNDEKPLAAYDYGGAVTEAQLPFVTEYAVAVSEGVCPAELLKIFERDL
jgi:hypothetical protein